MEKYDATVSMTPMSGFGTPTMTVSDEMLPEGWIVSDSDWSEFTDSDFAFPEELIWEGIADGASEPGTESSVSSDSLTAESLACGIYPNYLTSSMSDGSTGLSRKVQEVFTW